MEVVEEPMTGLKLLQPRVFGDSRGEFFQAFRHDQYAETLGAQHWVQDNVSRSQQGVVRGLHFQLPPKAQGKLISALEGTIVDVVVDLRSDSPSFGQGYSATLSAENHRQLFVPEGFAHGFFVQSPWATVHYKCTEYYAPEAESGLAWNSPGLALDWGLLPGLETVLSEKDQKWDAFDPEKRYF